MEIIIYNNTYNYLIDNDLTSQNQSGFKPGDSCINQLISITHDILNLLDEGLEVRGVFLDISKAFDKVGTTDWFINYNRTVFLVNYWIF